MPSPPWSRRHRGRGGIPDRGPPGPYPRVSWPTPSLLRFASSWKIHGSDVEPSSCHPGKPVHLETSKCTTGAVSLREEGHGGTARGAVEVGVPPRRFAQGLTRLKHGGSRSESDPERVRRGHSSGCGDRRVRARGGGFGSHRRRISSASPGKSGWMNGMSGRPWCRSGPLLPPAGARLLPSMAPSSVVASRVVPGDREELAQEDRRVHGGRAAASGRQEE